MFEDRDYSWCMAQLLANVPGDVTKVEGSLIFTTLSPVAMELERMYMELDTILEETFADTASYAYLEQRAAERGVYPKEATPCIARGVFDAVVPNGSRFFIGDFTYISGAALEGTTPYEYAMTCEDYGSRPNALLGELTAIDYVENLEKAEITEILTPGTDQENVEVFRQRYFDSFNSLSFGGNPTDYMERTGKMSGVGAVHVYPTWNGGGTVKLELLGEDYMPATSGVVKAVHDAYHPDGDLLNGLAPIGHEVTVVAAQASPVSVSATVSIDDTTTIEDVTTAIRAIFSEYLLELRKTWQSEYWDNNSGLTVRVAVVESRILNVKGVIDVTDTKLNNERANIIYDVHNVPTVGEVVISG